MEKYSEWLLGRNLLSAAISNSGHLALKRKQRAVMFMDICGFTHWSEDRTPEVVVNMLNTYFERAKQVWKTSDVIKIKYTADEVMAIFPTSESAVKSALLLNNLVGDFLHEYRLSAGIGIHQGNLVEDLIGSKDIKMYDVIGDTVNTAKRICDQAQGDEVLISEDVYLVLESALNIATPRQISAKGKTE